jgi:hypothetical protein
MSRQVDKKIDNLDDKFAKVLAALRLKQGKFALKAQIDPGTLSKALERGSLSDDIVEKIHDAHGVRIEYWNDGKEPIIDKNHTAVPDDPPLNKKDPEEYWILIRNLDRMGELNEFMLRELKRYKERFGDL